MENIAATSQNKETFEDYEGFVEKFKPKLTTDDCYTPTIVYEAVADWTAKEYGLDKFNFVRPFYPGGDYAEHDEGLGMGNWLPDEIPVPHPQCLCAQWAVIPDSLESIGAQIGRWASGEPDEVLDEWYAQYGDRNPNGDPREIVKEGLKFEGNGGRMYSGAISGALNTDSIEAQKHAERYYEAVRKMSTDVRRIAENTGFDEDLIRSIKNFVFLEKHDLGDGRYDRFDASYFMAQSWQRLIDDKRILSHDITLLNHEKMERELMQQGYSQDEAHRITLETYNYSKEARDYYGEIEKYKKN